VNRGPSMVDITPKPIVHRQASATGRILLKEETIKRIRSGKIEKGDPISTARVAAVLAAKATSSIIPLCHPLPLTNVQIEEQLSKSDVTMTVTVKATAKTGVEMEALTALSAALLTIWDMTKQYEKDDDGQYPTTSIEGIRVTNKTKEKAAD
jgi:cyclic pyranopterin phosphate synthase